MTNSTTSLEITHVTPSDGNVFADLGFSADEAEKLKADANSLITAKRQLMSTLATWISENGYKQSQAAELLGVTRPRVSDVVNHKTEKFTVDSLINMVNKTGYSVHISIQ